MRIVLLAALLLAGLASASAKKSMLLTLVVQAKVSLPPSPCPDSTSSEAESERSLGPLLRKLFDAPPSSLTSRSSTEQFSQTATSPPPTLPPPMTSAEPPSSPSGSPYQVLSFPDLSLPRPLPGEPFSPPALPSLTSPSPMQFYLMIPLQPYLCYQTSPMPLVTYEMPRLCRCRQHFK